MSGGARSERYVVRPFINIEEADEALDKVRLYVGDTENEHGTITLPDVTLHNAELALSLPSPDEVREHVQKTVIAPVDCGIVVLVRGTSHRSSRILLNEYCHTAHYETEFRIERNEAELILKDRDGFTVTVAIALLHDLTPEPLRPHLAGTWLARRDFRVVPERDETSFSPEELTDEIRAAFKLPAKTPSYISVDEGVLLEAEVLSDAVKVYLDRDVLRLLQQSQADTLALQIQSELAASTMNAVARAGLKAIAEELGRVPVQSDLEEYEAIKKFFDRLARLLGLDLSTVFGLVDDPDRLSAHLRAGFAVQKHTIDALKNTPTQKVQE